MENLEKTVSDILEKMSQATETHGPEVVEAMVFGVFVKGLVNIGIGLAVLVGLFFMVASISSSKKKFDENWNKDWKSSSWGDYMEEQFAPLSICFLLGVVGVAILLFTLTLPDNWVAVFAPESVAIWHFLK